jgi:hypothetical protein
VRRLLMRRRPSLWPATIRVAAHPHPWTPSPRVVGACTLAVATGTVSHRIKNPGRCNRTTAQNSGPIARRADTGNGERHVVAFASISYPVVALGVGVARRANSLLWGVVPGCERPARADSGPAVARVDRRSTGGAQVPDGVSGEVDPPGKRVAWRADAGTGLVGLHQHRPASVALTSSKVGLTYRHRRARRAR